MTTNMLPDNSYSILWKTYKMICNERTLISTRFSFTLL